MKKIFMAIVAVLITATISGAAEFGAAMLTTDVNFEWTANTEPDLNGYRIYRSDASGNYDNTKLIGTAGPGATQYADIAVEDGPWFWVVTAVDTAGNESNWSAEVSATLDTDPPSPPQGLHIVPAIIVPLILD